MTQAATFALLMNAVTLLSDFGLQDATLAKAKGILMTYIPNVPMVDISHHVEPYQTSQAAYLLASAYRSFPKNTCHLVLFDIFYQKESVMVLCEKDGHYFLAPDNGILSLTFDSAATTLWKAATVNAKDGFGAWMQKLGWLLQSLQTSSPAQLGLPLFDAQNTPVHWLPKLEGNTLECHVMYIDRFENVVLNITRQQFEAVQANRPFTIRFMRDEVITSIKQHYTDVRESEKLCRFNAAGYLELAINRGKAASLFGLQVRQDKNLMYNTVKIFFE